MAERSTRFWRVAGGFLLLLLLSACSSDGDGSGFDAQESTTTTTATTTATGPTTADDPPPASAEAMAAAVAFMDARSRRDLEMTTTLLSQDAMIHDFGFWPRTPDEYAGLFQWFDIFDWQWDVDECSQLSAGPPVRVACTYLMENDWSRTTGVDPVPGQIEFLVADGEIVQVDSDTGAWVDRVWLPWFDWLDEFHPAQIPVLYRFDNDGNLTGGPATTDAALDLNREYLPEYVEWNQ